jgi:sugar (pentulose or hexulose) kinase
MIDDVTQVVLTIDVGSSSIKCGVYEIIEDTNVQQLDNCFLSLSIRTVEPNTGKIELISTNEEGNSLFDDIDGLIDAMLDRLRTYPKELNVRGIGFSTFCMNLLALDQLGNPLGKDATISYACSTEAVRNECAILKR